MSAFEKWSAELDAAKASVADRLDSADAGVYADEPAALVEFVTAAIGSVRDGEPLGQSWFRGLAHRVARAIARKDEPTLLSAESALRDLYRASGTSKAGANDEQTITQAYVASALEVALAGLAAVGTNVSVDYVSGSELRQKFLSIVAATPNISGRVLAAQLGSETGKVMDEGQLSRLAKGLSDRGLVDRSKVGRRVLWQTTPRGRRVITLLGLRPEDSAVTTARGQHSLDGLRRLLSRLELESGNEPQLLTEGGAVLTTLPKPSGLVDVCIEQTVGDIDNIAVVLQQSGVVHYGQFVDGLVRFEDLPPGSYAAKVTRALAFAGSTFVQVEARPTALAAASTSPLKTLQELWSQDNALHVVVGLRPDDGLEARFESTSPRWATGVPVIKWHRHTGTAETLLVPLAAVASERWEASVLLENTPEEGQLEMPTAPVSWQDVRDAPVFVDAILSSIAASTEYAQTLSAWESVFTELPYTVMKSVAAVLEDHGYATAHGSNKGR